MRFLVPQMFCFLKCGTRRWIIARYRHHWDRTTTRVSSNADNYMLPSIVLHVIATSSKKRERDNHTCSAAEGLTVERPQPRRCSSSPDQRQAPHRWILVSFCIFLQRNEIFEFRIQPLAVPNIECFAWRTVTKNILGSTLMVVRSNSLQKIQRKHDWPHHDHDRNAWIRKLLCEISRGWTKPSTGNRSLTFHRKMSLGQKRLSITSSRKLQMAYDFKSKTF